MYQAMYQRFCISIVGYMQPSSSKLLKDWSEGWQENKTTDDEQIKEINTDPPDRNKTSSTISHKRQNQVIPKMANQLSSSSIYLEPSGRLYVYGKDFFFKNQTQISFEDQIGSKDQGECQFDIFSTQGIGRTSIKAILRWRDPTSFTKYFILRSIKIVVKQEDKLRQIRRIIKLPLEDHDLSILHLQQYLHLRIVSQKDKYILKTTRLVKYKQKLTYDYIDAEIVSFTVLDISKEPIIEVQLYPPPLRLEVQRYAINVNDDLVEFDARSSIIVDILFVDSDRHVQVPLYINPQQIRHENAGKLKDRIIQYMLEYFEMPKGHFQGYQLIITEEKCFKIVQDEQQVDKILHMGVNLFKFQPDYRLQKRKIQQKLDNKNYHEKIQPTLLRYALYLHDDQLIVKGKSSLEKIYVGSCCQGLEIISSDLNYERDQEQWLRYQKTHRHDYTCSMIVVTYLNNKNGQENTIRLYQNNVILYSESKTPYEYSFCTVGELFEMLRMRKWVYIFDSINNCLQATKAIRQEPALHKFYTIQTDRKDRYNMIVINGIRMLNMALLKHSNIMINIEELRGSQKQKQDPYSHQIIYYINQEEMSIKHAYQILQKSKVKQHKHISKLPIKTYFNNDIYLIHKVPHVVAKPPSQDNQGKKDYYTNLFYCKIDRNNFQQIHGKICKEQHQQYSIIFAKHPVRLYKTIQQASQDLKQNQYLFQLMLNNYQKCRNYNQDYISESTYLLVSNWNVKAARGVQLEKPSFSSDIFVLWVDDVPSNNTRIIDDIYNQASLTGKNIEINQVTSTQSALAWIKLFYPYFKWIRPVCKVKLITDMHRDFEKQAGADLLEKIQSLGIKIQLSFFVSDQERVKQIVFNRQALKAIYYLVITDTVQIQRWCLEEPTPLINYISQSKKLEP